MERLITNQEGRLCSFSGSLGTTGDSLVRKHHDHASRALRPRVCLAMPLYNQTTFLAESLRSLLSQTYSDLRLIIVDDSTEPGPGEIARKFAAQDNRIAYFKNESRKGLIDNWKACFQQVGDVDYFAWVSDHDLWHPDWLRSMISVLDSNPHVVLVYPEVVQITATGRRHPRNGPVLPSTLGLSASQRVIAVVRDAKGYGKMVYGLFRAAALRSVGVFRSVLKPDVVLLIELSFRGDFYHIDRELMYRRHLAGFSIARQKKTLFVRKPWYLVLPWPIVNTIVLAWNTAIRPNSGKLARRCLGLRASWLHWRRCWARQMKETKKQFTRRSRA